MHYLHAEIEDEMLPRSAASVNEDETEEEAQDRLERLSAEHDAFLESFESEEAFLAFSGEEGADIGCRVGLNHSSYASPCVACRPDTRSLTHPTNAPNAGN